MSADIKELPRDWFVAVDRCSLVAGGTVDTRPQIGYSYRLGIRFGMKGDGARPKLQIVGCNERSVREKAADLISTTAGRENGLLIAWLQCTQVDGTSHNWRCPVIAYNASRTIEQSSPPRFGM